ncbi:transcriptional regulator with XRE-family HTH domain [Tumebacillus sp. BK434]|uniref:helix-turn-helix domain-containing protein n=1 Tax=Tumebacillus sp. BK434 TaxID=2512169 RepID=UPI00104EA029|nr:helix-turn-helix transcriptional regulator [Tumebacillus sp. BK434]TCP55388.1 transcriptional regulator with XRE-family HTH domain [Tumebacillus sp. BK434]
MGFPQRLKELRKSRKLSQETLGREVGIDRTSISHYENSEENDERIPRLDTLKKIADFFDVTYDYLLGRTDEPLVKEDPALYKVTPAAQVEYPEEIRHFLLTLPDMLLQVPNEEREAVIRELEQTVQHRIPNNKTRS